MTQKLFNELRTKYPQFIYDSFKVEKKNNNLKFSYRFIIEPDIVFNPTVTIKNIPVSRIEALNDSVINNLAFHIGLAEIPSYWKATCSPDILIKAGTLDKEQINYWEKTLLKGMGEFYFVNNIDFTEKNFINIKTESSEKVKRGVFKERIKNEKTIIPVGGGKDSIVTIEALMGKIRTNVLMLNKIKCDEDVAKRAGYRDPITIDRNMDQKLKCLNSKGFLNGHNPFSTYLAFISISCAVLFHY